MKDIDVSFIVPAQLSMKTIHQTLSSIENQKTTLRFEVIVIVQLKDHLMVDSDRITVLKAPLSGASYARNTGIKEAKGRVIAFVDGDTILHENWLQTLYESLVSGNWSSAQGRIVTKGKDPDSVFGKFRELSSKLHRDGLTLSHYPMPVINTAACLYRKEALQYFREDVRNAEDIELSWRILNMGSGGFCYNGKAEATCFYLPESYENFLKRNFKVGRHLRTISEFYGSDFSSRFRKSMIESLKKEMFLLSENVSLALLMRILASLVTVVAVRFPVPLAASARVIASDSFFINGRQSLPEERLILCDGSLRKLNLKTFESTYMNHFQILRDQKGRMMVLGEEL